MHNILLNNTIVGKQFHYLPICHSTNDMAFQMLKEGKATHGLLIMAGKQFSGKGQRGNVWESEPNKNLTFSLVLRSLNVSPSEQFLISMAVANGIHSFLETKVDAEVFVKWPNDIIINNRKICGVLIENGIKGSNLEYSVIGIGLNVNQEKFEYSTATSLKLIAKADFDIEKQLQELSAHLNTQLEHLMDGHYDRIKERYLRSMYRLDEVHQYKVGSRVFHGRITGINLQGQLLVDVAGVISKYNFKEIEYII